MRKGIIVCRLSLIKAYLLAFHVLRIFRDSAPLTSNNQVGKCVRSVFLCQPQQNGAQTLKSHCRRSRSIPAGDLKRLE